MSFERGHAFEFLGEEAVLFRMLLNLLKNRKVFSKAEVLKVLFKLKIWFEKHMVDLAKQKDILECLEHMRHDDFSSQKWLKQQWFRNLCEGRVKYSSYLNRKAGSQESWLSHDLLSTQLDDDVTQHLGRFQTIYKDLEELCLAVRNDRIYDDDDEDDEGHEGREYQSAVLRDLYDKLGEWMESLKIELVKGDERLKRFGVDADGIFYESMGCTKRDLLSKNGFKEVSVLC